MMRCAYGTILEVLLIPLDCFVQSAFEVIFWVVSEYGSSFGDVGIGVFDVAGAVWAEMRLNVFAECFGQRMVDVDEVLATAVGDVECLACCFVWCEAGFKICFNNILDVSEVAALFPISIYCRTLIIQKLLDELGYHGSICSMRVLSASEDIEVS